MFWRVHGHCGARILLGDGVVANVLLKQRQQRCEHHPCRHTRFRRFVGGVRKASPLHAQVLGAFAGATLVWLHFLPHWKGTPDQSLKLACFCTAPAIRRFSANLLSEIIGTFVLVLVAEAIFPKAVAASGPASGLGPYLVAALVWGIGLSLGGTTGYAINPARDFGPASPMPCCPSRGKEFRTDAMLGAGCRAPHRRQSGWSAVTAHWSLARIGGAHCSSLCGVDDTASNELIAADLLRAVQAGRSLLLLTGRTEHLQYFAAKLETTVKHVFVLKGGRGK